ncbi:MAG: sulfatase-like hydrolase/transferase, partial [Oscillospiraceae bacterium]|nr:sulfatase-like hydrolase/transferase [Oscillospiraceae bacterium]
MGKLLKQTREWGKLKFFQWMLWISYPVFAIFCLFVMDYFNFYHQEKLGSVIYFIMQHPLSYLFEVLVILFLAMVTLLLGRKLWIAGGLLGLLSLLCSFVNYFKISLNGDNFTPRDIPMLISGWELFSFLSTPGPGWFYAACAVILVWCIAYFLLGTELPVTWKIRLPMAILSVVVMCVIFSSEDRADEILGHFSMNPVDTILQSSNYTANGFVGAFTLNLICMHEAEPDGYSQELIESILEPYTATETEGELFDVIVVLSESYADIRQLPGLEFSENPMAKYDELSERDNCYSGKMYSTALGGGTVRPEFDILTGLTTDYLRIGASPWEKVSGDFDSYVSNYKSAGYRTIALHPYDKKFYSRSSAYGFVGFDEFYDQSDLEQLFDLEYKRGHVTDQATLEAMEYYLEQSEDPVFLFAITMQNHQPYNVSEESEITVRVDSELLSADILESVVTYTQ